ncbi:MAG: 30S ribosomal protein S1 [Flavobacteriales bacterium]|nr:30S ribosomal protein S1 [Flavobacteriales bacterium]
MAEENKDQVSESEETNNEAVDQTAEETTPENVEETADSTEETEVEATADEDADSDESSDDDDDDDNVIIHSSRDDDDDDDNSDDDEDEGDVDLSSNSGPVSFREHVDISQLGSEGEADFDWDALEEDEDHYKKEERQQLEELYSGSLTSIVEKEVTEGTVVSVSKKEVVVNIGYKSEGIVAASEFRYNPELKAGDVVPIYVEQQEDKNGQLVISHRTARIHSAWEKVNRSLEHDEVITGFVKCRTKGGLIVDVFGVEAFLPGSQIDVKPIRDYDVYVGKQMEFKVVKINHEFKNVVVSHKALIEAELEEQKKKIIGGLEKGQVLEGTVKNITSYGVFVDLGGVDGLIHITDLSWGRINHPEEVVELDQKIQVVILDFDDDKRRIALGLKQLSDHPWDALSESLEVGQEVEGRVVVLADYGAFVEIQPGVEGLIHVSEMSWSQHLRSAQDFLKVGDTVKAVILTLDREERKMSLGMKQLMDDPWENIEARYPIESKHKATVRNFTNFGVFVELEEGVDGLIHISDLSWSKKIKHPSEFCNVGDEIEVVVLELDKENRRLSLGHKQLEENPWDVFETVFSEGSTHQGTVVRKEGSQYVVSLPYGVEGYVSKKHLTREDGSSADLEDTLDFTVIEFNKSAKRIVVSHLRTYEEAPAEEKKRRTGNTGGGSGSSSAVKKVQDSLEKTTLGDLGVLESLKQEMESGENKAAAKADEAAEADNSEEENDDEKA